MSRMYQVTIRINATARYSVKGRDIDDGDTINMEEVDADVSQALEDAGFSMAFNDLEVELLGCIEDDTHTQDRSDA